MRLLRWIAAAAGVAVCVGCTTLDAPRRDQTTRASDPQRQILVMLRESSDRHYRPGAPQMASYRTGSVPARELRTMQDLARQYDFRVLSDWPMPSLGVRCFLGEVAAGEISREVASRVAADPRVESAQPVQLFQIMGHNDPYYDLQTSAKVLNLDELHRIATGRHVRVAQIDTGVDTRHPDLQGQLAQIKNFVDTSEYTAELHGTAVAGIIVAKADNRVGIVGVAPAATLLPLRACWQAQTGQGALCSSFTLAKALQYALTQQVRVLNLSVAGPQDTLLARLIDKAIDKGMTVVVAVDLAAPAASFPANHAKVIPVASSETATAQSAVILAPGDHVLTTTPNGSWGFVSGSSFAAAHVTGITALLLEVSPRLQPAEIAALFHQEMNNDASPNGAAVVNACAVLAHAANQRDCHCCEETAARRPRHHAVGPSS